MKFLALIVLALAAVALAEEKDKEVAVEKKTEKRGVVGVGYGGYGGYGGYAAPALGYGGYAAPALGYGGYAAAPAVAAVHAAPVAAVHAAPAIGYSGYGGYGLGHGLGYAAPAVARVGYAAPAVAAAPALSYHPAPVARLEDEFADEFISFPYEFLSEDSAANSTHETKTTPAPSSRWRKYLSSWFPWAFNSTESSATHSAANSEDRSWFPRLSKWRDDHVKKSGRRGSPLVVVELHVAAPVVHAAPAVAAVHAAPVAAVHAAPAIGYSGYGGYGLGYGGIARSAYGYGGLAYGGYGGYGGYAAPALVH